MRLRLGKTDSRAGLRRGRLWLVKCGVAALPLAVVIGAIPLVSGGFGANALDSELAGYRAAGLFDHAYDHLIWDIAQPFVWHTRLDRSMTIDSHRVPGGLNLYVLRSDPKHYFGAFSCGCSAVPPGDTIVCDAALLKYMSELLAEPRSGLYQREFLQTWLKARRQLGEPVGARARRAGLQAYQNITLAYSQALLRWVIGHEIGHVWLRQLQQSSMPPQRREAAADSFVVRALSRNGAPDDVSYLDLMLESTVDTLYVNAVRQARPGAGPAPGTAADPAALPDVTLAGDGGHPPLLLRALAMLQILGKQPGYPAYHYLTGFVHTIERKIRVASPGAKLTLCGTEPTAYLGQEFVILPKAVSRATFVSGLFNIGLIWADMTYYAEAEHTFSQAVNLAKRVAGPKRAGLLAEAYRWRGTIRFIRRNYSGARADLSSALALSGGQATAHSLLGWVDLSLGDSAGAAASWRLALRINPGQADPLAGLAIVEVAHGHLKRGIADYRAAVAHDRGYASDVWLEFSRFWPEATIRQLSKVRHLANQ